MLAGLDGDLVATVEEHQGAVARVFAHRRTRFARSHALGEDAARRRGVAEGAAALEDVGEGVT